MIRKGDLDQVLHDPRLTSDAVRLVLHVAMMGPGRHEIDGTELTILLGKTDKPIKRAADIAKRCGYLEWGQGGRGHPNWYEYIGESSEVTDTSEKAPKYAGYIGESSEVNAPRTRDDVCLESKASSSPSPPARTRVREPGRLKAWLGPYAEAARRMAVSAEHSATWPEAVLGLYGPGGTQEGIWSGVPPPERPRILAVAMDHYTATGKPYNNRLFRGYLRGEIDEYDNERRPRRRGAESQVPGGPPSPWPATGTDGHPGQARRGRFRIE